MSSIATKQKQRQERKAKRRERATRKAKVHKRQVLARRRQWDRARRASERRERRDHHRRTQREFRFRVKVVRHFHRLRGQGISEQRAVELSWDKYRPRQEGDLRLSQSTIRNWVRQVKRAHGNYSVLRPKSRRPKTIKLRIPAQVIEIIFTLRHQLGWGGHRIAAELKERDIAQISGQAVYNIFERLGLPVKIYALKAKSEGIAYRRYEKKRPNAQWHIDLKQTSLVDGTRVYICIVIDDYSRYALAAVVGLEKTTEWTAQTTQQTVQEAGIPDQIVTDNGREFISVWEERLTKFGQLLEELDIDHVTTMPYYPQCNGKAEAFIRTLNRELLKRHTFESIEALQTALDEYLVYYNHYRLHSGLGWQAPVARFTGRAIRIRGLAGILGLEPMAADPKWGSSFCDPPITITPATTLNRHALALAVT